MSPSQELHATLQKLSVNQSPMGIEVIVKHFNCERNVVLVNLDILHELKFIEFTDAKREVVQLTDTGILAHI